MWLSLLSLLWLLTSHLYYVEGAADCSDNIDGGGWKLVRHSYDAWHPAADNLRGDQVYGIYNADPQSTNKWSIQFDTELQSNGKTEFLFGNGDCSQWLITDNDQFTTTHPGLYSAQILSSSTNANPYSAQWYMRPTAPEDPWISLVNHDSNYALLIYGENDFQGRRDRWSNAAADKSINVWIRNECWKHVITAKCNGVLTAATYGSDSEQCWKGYSDADINNLMSSTREMKIEFADAADPARSTLYIELVNGVNDQDLPAMNTPRDWALLPNPNGAKWKWHEADAYLGPCTHSAQLSGINWFHFKTADANGKCEDGNYENRVTPNGFINVDQATFWPVTGWGNIKIYVKTPSCQDTVDIDCEEGAWQNEGDCSTSCGGGLQVQTRSVTQEKQGNGRECGDLRQEIPCNTDPCPIHCVVGAWQPDGGGCDKLCGGGLRSETREITQQDQHGGDRGECDTLQRDVACNEETCCPDIDTQTFDWDTLTEQGVAIPYYKLQDFYVDDDDLSLHIVVDVAYVGMASADDEGPEQANFGVTYVLDFEDFDAHKDLINEPGNCQNRKHESFANKNFDEFWTYSLQPQNGDIGKDTNDFLAYPPPPSDKWTVKMRDNDCKTVRYEGDFTWQELRKCNKYDAQPTDNSYTSVIADDNWLNLTGTFYVNLVSPFWYGTTDSKYYRVYQLISQPFVIAVSSSIYVLGSTGINVMTMSIIAVYKEDDETDFKLVVMTETTDYMKLKRNNNDNEFKFTKKDGNNNNFNDNTFTAPELAENTACLDNKAFLCIQLWQIEATDIVCQQDVSGTDFSGKYAMTFNAECKPGDYNTYCNQWLTDHPDIKQQIYLSTDLVWKDTICKPEVFTVELSAGMIFYALIDDTKDIYDHANALILDADNNIDNTAHLYQVGTDRVYVEINTKFPDATMHIFNTELINVWICTFPPDTNVPKKIGTDGTTETMTSMGCFNTKRDAFDADFHHIFGITPPLNLHEFREESEDISNIERFSFIVPHEVARDRLYVHAQIEVELQELTTTSSPRRRVLLNVNTANRIQHIGDQIGINHGQKHQEPPQQKEPKYQEPPQQQPPPINNIPHQQPSPSTFVLSLSSSSILIIGGLLAFILTVNIIFMCYYNCYKTQTSQRATSVLTTTRREKKGRYAAVQNVDSEDLADQANLI